MASVPKYSGWHSVEPSCVCQKRPALQVSRHMSCKYLSKWNVLAKKQSYSKQVYKTLSNKSNKRGRSFTTCCCSHCVLLVIPKVDSDRCLGQKKMRLYKLIDWVPKWEQERRKWKVMLLMTFTQLEQQENKKTYFRQLLNEERRQRRLL